MDPRQIVGLLASESRQRLWASITVADLVNGRPLSVANFSPAEKRDVQTLRDAGMVRTEGDVVRAEPGVFGEALAKLPRDTTPANGPHRFFVNGVLESMPRRASDRAEVIECVADQLFPEPGADLTERELMAALTEFVSDPVGVRRALVDYGLVGRERDGSRYWRV